MQGYTMLGSRGHANSTVVNMMPSSDPERDSIALSRFAAVAFRPTDISLSVPKKDGTGVLGILNAQMMVFTTEALRGQAEPIQLKDAALFSQYKVSDIPGTPGKYQPFFRDFLDGNNQVKDGVIGSLYVARVETLPSKKFGRPFAVWKQVDPAVAERAVAAFNAANWDGDDTIADADDDDWL